MKGKPEFKFNELIENRLVNYLEKFHRGKKNSIPHMLLAKRTGIEPRTIRALISHLVTDHEVPIAGTSDSGIFYISTKEEMEQAFEELMSRVGKIRKRADAVKEAFYESVNNKPKLFDI